MAPFLSLAGTSPTRPLLCPRFRVWVLAIAYQHPLVTVRLWQRCPGHRRRIKPVLPAAGASPGVISFVPGLPWECPSPSAEASAQQGQAGKDVACRGPWVVCCVCVWELPQWLCRRQIFILRAGDGRAAFIPTLVWEVAHVRSPGVRFYAASAVGRDGAEMWGRHRCSPLLQTPSHLTQRPQE